MCKLLRKNSSAIIIVFTLLFGAAANAERTPPGSFLRWRVSNGEEAAQQVLKDKLVAQRYARFFKSSPQTVASFYRRLAVVALPEPIITRVYFFGKGGKLISEMRRLPAGRTVFMDDAGRAMFDHRCGNPLIEQIVEPAVTSKVVPKPFTTASDTQSIEPIPVFEALSPQPAIEPFFSMALPTDVEPYIAVIGTASSSFNPIALFIPPIVGMTGGGGGKTEENPIPPAPEPATMLMSATGLFVGYLARRRRV